MKINTTYFKLKERYIYGSSRVGVRNSDLDVLPLPDKDFSMTTVHYSIGSRTYELSNHLGNVLSVISDKVIPVFPYSNVISEMRADIRVAQDYSPFGVQLEGRKLTLTGVNKKYRQGFNGMEMDNEVHPGSDGLATGNSYDFGARMLDPRLGKFLSLDAYASKYPSISPYAFVANNPILNREIDGNDFIKSPEFEKSGFNTVLNDIIVNNSAFKKYFEMFQKAGPLDIYFEVNNDLVPFGKWANTKWNFYTKINSKGNPYLTQLDGGIAFRDDLEGLNDLGKMVLLSHEA